MQNWKTKKLEIYFISYWCGVSHSFTGLEIIWTTLIYQINTKNEKNKTKIHYGCLMSTMNENNRLCRHTRGLWPQELFVHCADSLPTEPDKAKLTLQFTGRPFSKPLVFFLLWHFKSFPETRQLIENKYHRIRFMRLTKNLKNQYFI